MKIVLAAQNYRITGGSDKIFFDQKKLLEERNHKVIPFCAKHPDNLESGWENYFPKTASFERQSISDIAKYIYSFQAKTNIRKLLDKEKPDLVHCHIYYGKITASIINEIKKQDIPLIQTLHEYKTVCPVYTLTSQGSPCDSCKGFNFYHATLKKCNRNSFSRSLVSTIESYTSLALGSIRKFDHFIAVSDFLRNKVIEMGIPKEKITTIHNFTDVDSYTPKYSNDKYFLFFGRLEKNKGVWNLISVFSKNKSLNLVIAGDGSELNSILKYIEENNIENIRAIGFQDQSSLQALISNSICVLVPSLWNETFGLTITESFSYGKPVIASRIGGIPEVASDGEDSILIEPGNEEELTAALHFMIKDPSHASEMGRQARANVMKKFNPELHYQKLLTLYKRFL